MRKMRQAAKDSGSSADACDYDALLGDTLKRAVEQNRTLTRVDLIIALRAVAPHFGLKEAKDIVDDFCTRKAPDLLATLKLDGNLALMLKNLLKPPPG